jgi:pyruvate kinase
MMSRIVHEAERHTFSTPRVGAFGFSPVTGMEDQRPAQAPDSSVARTARVQPITESVVEAAGLISHRLGAALLVVDTHSGRTALALSKLRNRAPTLALTSDQLTARAMSLFWGVTPLFLPDISDRAQLRTYIVEWCRARALLAPGDRVVRIRGTVPADPTHNEIEVYEVR